MKSQLTNEELMTELKILRQRVIELSPLEQKNTQLEHALSASQAQLVESQCLAKLGCWSLNLLDGHLDWSEQIYILHDKNSKDYIPSFDDFASMVHDDDREMMQLNFDEALADDEKPYHVVVRMVNDSKREWIMEAIASVKRDENNKAISIFGTAQDITSRKQLEDELSKHRDKLESLVAQRTAELNQEINERIQAEQALLAEKQLSEEYLNSLPGLFYVFDEERFVKWNRQWERVSGFSTEELAVRYGTDFFEGDEASHIAERMKKVFEEGSAEAEAFLVTKDHRKIPYHFTGIRKELDGKDYLIGLGIDITERKRMDRRLRDSERLMRTITENYPNSYLSIIKSDFTVSFASGQEFRNQNIDPETYIGCTVEQIFGGQSYLIKGCYESTFLGEPSYCELYAREQYLQVKTVPLVDEGGSIPRILAVIENITERKLAEKELALHQQQLEVLVNERTAKLRELIKQQSKTQHQLIEAEKNATIASQAKSDFLAHMSHEIRTPMNGIIATADLLLDVEKDDERYRFLQIIKQSGTALVSILNDILDMSKIEAGKMRLDFYSFNLRQLVNSVVAMFELALQKNDLHMYCHIAEAVPENIVSDSSRLRQVLVNLIGNAVKFSGKKGSINIYIDVLDNDENVLSQTEKPIESLQFKVSDNGVGIAEEQQERIFESFTQADISVTREFGGTGLGLQICKQLVHLMGGEIRVESTLGVGTDIFFQIPLKVGRVDKNTPLIQRQNRMPASKISILLIEDNLVNRKVACALLVRLGYSVETAENGQLGLDELKNNSYDIVLMDCQMPVMDGYEATRQIRSMAGYTKLPIIAMTASATKEERLRCRDAGMSDFIAKPIDMHQVKTTLSKWH